MHQHCNLGLGISGVLKIILRLLGAGPAKFGQYFVVRVRQFLARYLRRLIYANSCSVQPHRRAQLDLGWPWSAMAHAASECFFLPKLITKMRMEIHYTQLYIYAVSQKASPTFSTVTWKLIIRLR